MILWSIDALYDGLNDWMIDDNSYESGVNKFWWGKQTFDEVKKITPGYWLMSSTVIISECYYWW